MKKFVFLILPFVLFLQQVKAQFFCKAEGLKIHLHSHLNEQQSYRLIQKPASIFNYHPIYDEGYSLQKGNQFENIIEYPSNLFLVIATDSSSKSELVTLESGKSVFRIFSDKALFSENELLSYNSANGAIIDMSLNIKKAKKKTSFKIKKELVQPSTANYNEKLLELIYFNEPVSALNRQQIQSYLAVKYGISLSNGCNYYNSEGEVMWSADSNGIYRHNPTAIACDEMLGLDQKQSHNSNESWLSVGVDQIKALNILNHSVLDDQTYLFWASNGKDFGFIHDPSSLFDVMPRKWKMNLIMDRDKSIVGQIKLSSGVIGIDRLTENNNSVWLVVSENDSNDLFYSIMYRGNFDPGSGETSFDDIPLSYKDSYYFSFINAPDFFAIPAIDTSCANLKYNNIKIRIIGGAAPYYVTYMVGSNVRTIYSEEEVIELHEVKSGTEIQIEITDSKGNLCEIKLPEDKNGKHNEIVNITTTLENGNNAFLLEPDNISPEYLYSWWFNNDFLGEGNGINVSQPGVYNLKISDSKGCFIEKAYHVLPDENSLNSVLNVFPNPVKSSVPFRITYQLAANESKVIHILDMDGRNVWSKKMSNDQNEEFETIIYQPGIYMVIISGDNNTIMQKLVVL